VDTILDAGASIVVYVLNFLFRGSYRRRVIQEFFEHVRIVVDRGLPLAEGIERYAGSQHAGAIRYVLYSIADRVRAGEPLWAALRDHSPTFFPADTVAMVRAGEKSGMLGKALGNVVEDLTFHRDVKTRFTYTCAYLLGLLILGLFIVSVVVTFVFPRFADFWDEAGRVLPWPTTLFVNPSGLSIGAGSLISGGWILPVLVIVSFFLSRYLLGLPSGLATMIPGVRGAFIRHQTGRYLAALGMYLEARTPTDGAVAAAAEACRLTAIRRGRDEAAARVREGIPVGDALGSIKVLREDLLWRIRSAERRGDLTDTLFAIGSEEQEAAHRHFLYLLGWFRPISILVLGALEMIVVLAGYLPLFEIANLIKSEYL